MKSRKILGSVLAASMAFGSMAAYVASAADVENEKDGVTIRKDVTGEQFNDAMDSVVAVSYDAKAGEVEITLNVTKAEADKIKSDNPLLNAQGKNGGKNPVGLVIEDFAKYDDVQFLSGYEFDDDDAHELNYNEGTLTLWLKYAEDYTIKLADADLEKDEITTKNTDVITVKYVYAESKVIFSGEQTLDQAFTGGAVEKGDVKTDADNAIKFTGVVSENDRIVITYKDLASSASTSTKFEFVDNEGKSFSNAVTIANSAKGKITLTGDQAGDISALVGKKSSDPFYLIGTNAVVTKVELITYSPDDDNPVAVKDEDKKDEVDESKYEAEVTMDLGDDEVEEILAAIEEAEDEEVYTALTDALDAGDACIIDITFVDENGKEVEVTKEHSVEIELPEDFQGVDLFVYHVVDGVLELADYEISEDGTILTITSDSFSPFIISKVQLTDEAPAGDDEPAGENPETGIALAVAPVILAAGAVAVATMKKKH